MYTCKIIYKQIHKGKKENNKQKLRKKNKQTNKQTNKNKKITTLSFIFSSKMLSTKKQM